MNKKGFTLVEVIAVVALLAILVGLAGTSMIKKYNESKREAIIIQEGQLVESGDMVVQDYCKNPLNEGYQLQCDKYFQPYVDNNKNLIIEDNIYTKYICVKDLKELNYYSEELVYSGVQCSGVVVYKIDYETDLQKESYSVIKCGEDYITEVDNVNEYLTNFKECFDTEDSGGQVEEEKKYLLTVNFTELSPSGMKVATSHSQEYKKGASIDISVPKYTTVENEYTPFKHGSSQNANNLSLNADRTKLTGTMPEGNVVVNIVYSASTYILTVNYKEFNDVQGHINFPSKQYTLFYGESVEIPYENVDNFKIISPSNFTFQMEQEDVEIDVIYQQQEFNLTYNSNGGSACSSKKVTYNKAYGTLCTPSRTGYTFKGWYLNGTKVTSTTINNNYNNVTLTASWEANKYYVVYNCNGGTPTSSYSSEHTYDVTSNLSNNQCVKTGYVFTGWLGSNGTTYSDKQSVKNILSTNNSSITLTAQWTPLTYYIAFNSNGGSGSMSTISVTYGRTINLTNNTFTLTGHRFEGWTGSDGKSYANGASVTNLTTVHGSTVTMTARWTRCGGGTYLVNNTCTACPIGTFSSGGVNSCIPCAAGSYSNTTGSKSCYVCAAGSYNTGTGNTTCKSCEAGYYCTGGAHKAACTAGNYSAGGSSSCTICTAGYYCPGASNRIACVAGTYTNTTGKSSCTTCAAGSYNTSSGSTSCTTCTAGYYCTGGTNRTICPAGTYRTSTGGTSSSSCTTCTAGYYCTGGTNRTQCPAGTYRTSTGGTSSSSCSTCTAGYYCTGGTNRTQCPAGTYRTSTGGTSSSSCTTCEANYYCTGGSHRAACPTGYTSSQGSSSCTQIIYTVTISRNNTSYGTVSSTTLSIPYGTTYTASGNKITFSNGTTVTATATTATGYNTVFSSWSTTSGTITGNITITANFTRTPIKYTFTTAVNNSSYGSVTASISVAYGTTFTSSGSSITFSDGQKITASIKNATGYTTTFTGWTGGASGTVTGAKTLTANFSRRGNNYSVIYSCNGGTPTDAYSSNHVYGTASKLTANKCIKAGYTFGGWKDSSGTSYTDSQSVSTLVTTDNGSITLTAQWITNQYTVTLNANGGSVSSSSIKVSYNTSYNNLPTPTRTGYTFVGWFNGTATRDSSKEYKSYPWLYYADAYGDLYNAFGYNETSLENHYNQYGKTEGRRTSQYINSDVYTIQGNQTLYAGWSPNKDTKYVVNHYKQTTSGTYPTTPNETQTLYGTTGASINFNSYKKSYAGFGYKESKNSSGTVITSATIAPDGSTIINMYYVQYYVAVVYHPNGATTMEFQGTAMTDSQFQTNTSQLFYYEASIASGLPDIMNHDWIYLIRTGHRSTGNWYSGTIKINQSTVITGKSLAEHFGLDISSGNQTLHIYAEWQQCAGGTYSNLGNNSCDACPTGQYSAAGAGSCSTCAAGTFNTGTGNTSCSSCTAGYYCTGGASKSACAAGKWSNAGAKASSECYNCPAGSECPGNGVKNACPVNKYSLQGQTECTWCSSGYYTPSTGSSTCLPKTYYITFDGNGGTVGTTQKSVVYNTQIGDLPVPTRDGYKFFGWFDGTTTAQRDSTKLYKDHPMLHYSDYNFDLYDAFQYNETALVDHYETYGKNEPARYIGQYRSQDTWRSNQNITLYAGWYKTTVNITVNAAVKETVSCVNSDTSKNFSVTTNTTGTATATVSPGTYTCTGSVSGYSKSVTISASSTTVNVFPSGAIYWYGNGDNPNDSLYAVSGGFTPTEYRANGYGVNSRYAMSFQSYDNYMYYYHYCAQSSSGYVGSLFSGKAFSMSGYTKLTTKMTVSRCYGSSCIAYTGNGSSNETIIYAPTNNVDNYVNTWKVDATGTGSNQIKSVSVTDNGNHYYSMQLRTGWYYSSSVGSKCSQTFNSIYAIYRE